MLSNPPPTPGHTPGTRAAYARQDIAPGAAVPPLRAPPAGPAPGEEGFGRGGEEGEGEEGEGRREGGREGGDSGGRKGGTDGQTDVRMDGRTVGRTDKSRILTVIGMKMCQVHAIGRNAQLLPNHGFRP